MADGKRKKYYICRAASVNYAAETLLAAITLSGAAGATVVELFSCIANSRTHAASLFGQAGHELGPKFKGTAATALADHRLYR